MLKYKINPKSYRIPHPTEIFIEKIFVEQELDYNNSLNIHLVDIVGNLGSIMISADKIKGFVESFNQKINSNVELTKEVLENHSREYRINHKFKPNVFQMKQLPNLANDILSLNPHHIRVYGNEIAGSLDYNAWIMLVLTVHCKALTVNQWTYFKIMDHQKNGEGNTDICLFFTKKDAESLQKDLKSLNLSIK